MKNPLPLARCVAAVACCVSPGRLVSVHLKDIKEAGNSDADDLPLGLGVTNVKGVLRELRRQRFDGNISIDYERDWAHTVEDIAQCVGYVRGFADVEDKP